MNDHDRQMLGRVDMFEGLGAASLDKLASVARSQTFSAKEVVVRQDTAAAHVYVIMSGRLKAAAKADDGQQAAFSIMGPGEIFGEVAVVDGGPRSASVTGVDAGRLLAVERADFLHFVENHPKLAIRLMQVLAGRLRHLSERVEDGEFLDIRCRLAKLVVQLVDRFGREDEEGQHLEIKLSQQELGDLIGATRESVNKQLRQWTEQQWVARTGGTLVVKDLAALRNESNGL